MSHNITPETISWLTDRVKEEMQFMYEKGFKDGSDVGVKATLSVTNHVKRLDGMTQGKVDIEYSKTGSQNGQPHIYLVDVNGRKIAALWGTLEEKTANAEFIKQAMNGGE